MDKKIKPEALFPHSEVFKFNERVSFAKGGIISTQVVKTEKGNVSLFSFDKGEGLSEHTAPFSAIVQVIEGSAKILIGGASHTLTKGESIIMPANIPHAVEAPERFKMILTMIRQ